MRQCGHTMRGVQLREPGNVALTIPSGPAAGAGEVVLRVLAAGLCQTDLHIRSAADSRTPDGTTLGHEIAGVVEEIGAGVTQWRPGDRVVVHPCWSCGACSACLAGRQNACRRTGGRLNPPPTPGVTKNGGMADYVSAPASALVVDRRSRSRDRRHADRRRAHALSRDPDLQRASASGLDRGDHRARRARQSRGADPARDDRDARRRDRHLQRSDRRRAAVGGCHAALRRPDAAPRRSSR